jgi:hypothetical protein
MDDQSGMPPADDCSGNATCAQPALVPRLNEIGARLDAIQKEMAEHGEQALRLAVERAKLLVLVTDAHGMAGPAYVQYCVSHVGIKGKTEETRRRAAYEIRLLGVVLDTQTASLGDFFITQCEAEAKLRPHSFEWPSWRTAVRRIKKGLHEPQQGDAQPAGEQDAEEDAEEEQDENEPVDPVAALDAENARLRSDLLAAQQAHKSVRAEKEELQDRCYQLQAQQLAGLHALLSASEKQLWDAIPQVAEPEPEPQPKRYPDPAPQEPPEPPVAPQSPGGGMVIDLGSHRAQKRPTGTQKRPSATAKLTPLQAVVLETLPAEEPMQQAMLGKYLNLARPRIAQVLAQLKAKGLIGLVTDDPSPDNWVWRRLVASEDVS